MILLLFLFFFIDIILLEFSTLFFSVLRENVEFYSLIFILVHVAFIIYYILFAEGKYKNILLLGLILRLVILFADIYHWFPVLHSGADSETFHGIAKLNQIYDEQRKLTNYTPFLTFLYSITHSSRIIAQYFNLVMGVSILFIVRKIFEILDIDNKIALISMIILACMPNFVIFSGILLREAWVEFFVILSVYFFVRWFIGGNSLNIPLCMGSILFAAIMHSGTLVVIMGYILAFTSYNPSTGHIQFSTNTVSFVIIATVMVMLLGDSSDMFTGKFQSASSSDGLLATINADTTGDSAYLTWVKADSLWMGFVFSPLKMFYFLFSPLPTNWRGFGDIIAFMIDSSFYIFLCWNIARNYRFGNKFGNIKLFLLIGFSISVFVFAFGTYTAGTALRHRAKLLPMLTVLYAVSSSSLNIKEESEENE